MNLKFKNLNEGEQFVFVAQQEIPCKKMSQNKAYDYRSCSVKTTEPEYPVKRIQNLNISITYDIID